MNKEMKEPIDKVVELVDKNIDRLIEKISELGPEAEYGFNEVISKIAVESWSLVFTIILVCFVSSILFYKSIKYGTKTNWKGGESVVFGMFSGVLCLFSTMAVIVDVPIRLARALHPIGYFLLEVLK